MMSHKEIEFEEDYKFFPEGHQFILDLEGFEGPIDLLLVMARSQKVDLSCISILKLSEQYLHFIKQSKDLSLELAADYLVMAAWLAYLKSKLLLPEEQNDKEPSGEEMAETLSRRLKALDSMRDSGLKLFQRPLLGMDRHPRGIEYVENHSIMKDIPYSVGIGELLLAYSGVSNRKYDQKLIYPKSNLWSVQEALEHIKLLLTNAKKWMSLNFFMPKLVNSQKNKIYKNSIVSSLFTASLEMCRKGEVLIRQERPFGEIFLKKK